VTRLDRYRTSWARFWAGAVDTVVFVPLSFIDDALLSPERSPWILIAWATVSYSSYWLYSVLLHARYGQTVGKRLLRVKVLDLEELHPPSLRQAFLRDIGIVVLNTMSLFYLAYLVLTASYEAGAEFSSVPGEILTWAAVAWFVLELVTMLSNEKRRAFHDFIARTVVVRYA
jgi:uncharacterized RDD family membrane protein YckC